jgi:hypothetical protein
MVGEARMEFNRAKDGIQQSVVYRNVPYPPQVLYYLSLQTMVAMLSGDHNSPISEGQSLSYGVCALKGPTMDSRFLGLGI